jgi:hypothetical protein
MVCCKVNRRPFLDSSSCIYIELSVFREFLIESDDAVHSFFLISFNGSVQRGPIIVIFEIELRLVLNEYLSNSAAFLRILGVYIHDHVETGAAVLVDSVNGGTFLK